MNTPTDGTPMNAHDDFPGDGDALLAAEYVLGLLDRAMHATAQARTGTDPAFAQEVSAWEAHFAPWLTSVPPVDAPDHVWQRVREALGHVDPKSQRAASASPRPSLWDRLPFWRGLAAGGFAVAAASLAALTVTVQRIPVQGPPAAPQVVEATAPAAMPMVVSLRHEDGSAAYSATVDPASGVITLIPAFMPEDARDPELWVIPADGVPRSLGVISRDHAMRVVMPAAIRTTAEANSVFAVTLEPVGGSPSGKPTGPTIAKGNLINL